MIRPNYDIVERAISEIQLSPENDDIYGKLKRDEQMENLIASISNRGLQEPLIISADNYILSGHRRYFACQELGYETVPVRIQADVKREGNSEYHRLLTEFNPQRIKTAGTLLKEAILKHSDDDSTTLLRNHREASIQVEADFLEVEGVKWVREVSEKKQEFLDAAIKVVDSLQSYWPLSVRQIHYQLLNDPPLISRPKRSKFDLEKYRYRNDKTSYDALVALLTQARYNGHIAMQCIDDATRPRYANNGYSSLSEFIEEQMDGFLVGYHRDRQLDQPRHIECLGEKNTLMQILKPVCQDYYVPLSLGRGYGSIPIWRDMANRFRYSGKDAMTLVVASDYDPEGFDLADDAIRSLRDLWDIPVDYHRIAVNQEQIDELDLQADFNPAKVTSSRLDSFIERTGGEETWELESLPPDYLQEQVRAAIEANMDMDIYEQVVEQEEEDAERLVDFRQQLIDEFDF